MRNLRNGLVMICLVILLLSLTGCGESEKSTDPGSWGYECKVVYDALGGVINSREVRTTYYQANSYIYEPSGSSGMLITPERDGYILAGWYTEKEDVVDAQGNVSYVFKAEDRWDFELDRVLEDTTLYARWIPQGIVSYINADTNEVLFQKNITVDSTVKELSAAVLTLVTPSGTSLGGYYTDSSCTSTYEFGDYQHSELVLTDELIYSQLAEEFPEVIVPYEAPVKGESEEETTGNAYYFLHVINYDIVTDDEAVLAEIRTRKDEIIEANIQNYLTNTAGKLVYMKFTNGNIITVSKLEDLKKGSSYILGAADVDGYVFTSDIDFSGVTLGISDEFHGTIDGQGHTLSNLTLTVASSKREASGDKYFGLVKAMEGVTITNVNFDQISLTANTKEGVTLYAGILAGTGKDCTISNCSFTNISVAVSEQYTCSGTIYIGDLFGSSDNCVLENCTVDSVSVQADGANSSTLLIP